MSKGRRPYRGRMTNRTFGNGGFGLAFQFTHTAGQVAEALRGHFSPDDLAELARMVDRAADRRRRKGKDTGRGPALARLLQRASRPPAIEAPIQVFDRHLYVYPDGVVPCAPAAPGTWSSSCSTEKLTG